MRLAVVDLFAGAGGMSAGFASEGFEVVAAVESVPQFARTHKLNFPSSVTFTTDIRTLDLDSLQQAVRSSGPFDKLVVIGGPPCQSFSTIGRPKIRSLRVTNGSFEEDHRDYLFNDFFRVIELLRPDAFVMENVTELRSKKGGALFAECQRLTSVLGYSFNSSILNAVEFGVPQSRRRIFLTGCRSDKGLDFPMPTHQLFGKDTATLFDLSNRLLGAVTVRDAFEDLPIISDGIRAGDLPYLTKQPTNLYQKTLRNSSGVVGNNVCRVSNDRAKRVFPHLKPGDKYMDLPPEIRRILPFREDIFADKLKRLHPDRPSWTVIAHIGMDGYMYIHPWENRTLSVREAARLQSFPDSFVFLGNMREQYVQVGNAVPPRFASALAREVKRAVIKQGLAA